MKMINPVPEKNRNRCSLNEKVLVYKALAENWVEILLTGERKYVTSFVYNDNTGEHGAEFAHEASTSINTEKGTQDYYRSIQESVSRTSLLVNNS